MPLTRPRDNRRIQQRARRVRPLCRHLFSWRRPPI